MAWSLDLRGLTARQVATHNAGADLDANRRSALLLKRALLIAVATIAFPSAASARDGLPYLGLEAGVTKPRTVKLDYNLRALAVDDGVALEHKSGFEADLLAGYDLGLIRIEGELGWKRSGIEDVSINSGVFVTTGRPAAAGRTRVVSAMANLLFDLGGDDGLQVYAGGGLGLARTNVRARITGPGVPLGSGIYGSDRGMAYQLIGGMRLPVSYNVDLGLKYRYFTTKAEFGDNNGGLAAEGLDGRYKSHSLLASVFFNLGAAPQPVLESAPVVALPPEAAPAPATQTCPDGSVILVSDICPSPAPLPPPPPPAPERG